TVTGQWIGGFDGDYKGVVMVNVDEFVDRYGGSATFSPADARIPGVQVSFRTENKDSKFRIKTNLIAPVNPSTGLRDTWENIKGAYQPNTKVADSATIEGVFTDDSLTATVETSLGSKFSATVTRRPGSLDPEATSQLTGEKIGWEEYKDKV